MSKKKKFNERPFPYHHEVELTVTTLTNLGLGLGRVALEGTDASPKWVVMVAFALPGERIRARVFRNHANYSEADLIEVLSPSPHRIEPKCALFGACGGCQYQNLAYGEQLEWKRRQVAELLEHMAGITFGVSPVIGSPRPFGYRSKITPHFNAPRPDRELPIGFLRQGTRFDIVDVPRCEIATEPINERLTAARGEIRRRAGEGALKTGSTLLFRDAGGRVVTNHEERVAEEVPLGPGQTLRLDFLARDFFQNNPFILPAFACYVRDQARLSGARFLVDAYCGSGLFALAAAGAFERVAGVEVSESSVGFARANAAANGIPNAVFTAGDASSIFAGLDFPGRDTAVVIDPPRKGCDESFLRQLLDFRPRAVVYVSCDPATQMRDLRGFLEAGFAVTAVQPFDLFPQTRHLECVITLEGKAS
ncbi:MAG TPA: class I SAM-dependent RNA methyltransferase [Opitutaceae bacterium]|nr:class I SAM-dependent RNA methyltransferase [Opitutaceae bacterium]